MTAPARVTHAGVARWRARATGLPPLLAIDLHGVSLIEGVRAGFAIASVVALGQWVHWPGLMQAALGAMLTCLCDAGGPLRRRLPALFTFALCGTLITACFGLLRAVPFWAVTAAAAVVFVAGFARIYGQSAMQVGNLLTVVLVLALRTPLTPHRALVLGGTFLAGSFWAILLTAALWRLHPYRPARAAVAEAYRMLARLCADLRRLLEADEHDASMWDRHARAHRRAVREALERARATVLAAERMGRGARDRAARGWLRLGAAEQLFGALIALSDLAAGADSALAGRIGRMIRLIEPILLLQGRAVLTDHAAHRPGLDRAVAAIATVARSPRGQAASDGSASAMLQRVADAITASLRQSEALSEPRPTAPAATTATSWQWWRTARAGFAPNSASLRHALRASLAASLALAATMAWPLPYAHWFTITLVLTMQPYFALTFTKAVERIGGTVLGGMLAAALATVTTTPLSMSLALFPLAVAALAVRGVSFGLFMALLTPLVVLLSELGQPGRGELSIALARAGFTLGGGLLALLLAWLLWPAWEPERLRRELVNAVAAHGRFAAAEIGLLLGDVDAQAAAEARRDAGIASNALEASLQRALLEPRRGGARRLEAALTVDAALRRIAGRMTTLQLGADAARTHDATAWRAWADWLTRVTCEPSAASPPPALPARDPDADSLALVAEHLRVIAAALATAGEDR